MLVKYTLEKIKTKQNVFKSFQVIIVTFSYQAKITRDLETNKTRTFNANKMYNKVNTGVEIFF